MTESDAIFDAIVVGAGVAGAAAAIHLRSLGWRVAMLDRHEILPHRYESISAFAVQELTSLSIDIGYPISTLSAWWGADRERRVYHPQARIVERSLLIAALRARANERGVESFGFDNRFDLTRADGSWRFATSGSGFGTQSTLYGSFLVDATGRSSIVGRRLGSRRIAVDRLSSLSFAIQNPRASGVWTESTHDGWWNACLEPGGGTVSFFCAPHTVRDALLNISEYFELTSGLSERCSVRGAPALVRNCSSSLLVPSSGPGWIAVGDAAWTAQPLASVGIAKALRDARLAMKVIDGGKARYESFQTAEFHSYLSELGQHYALEPRWRSSSFWQAVRNHEALLHC